VICLAVVLAHHEAAAAPTWVDGTPKNPLALCGNSQTEGVVSWAGYVVDPAAGKPQLGQATYIHAEAVNTNCFGDAVTFELFLPPGASFAVSAATPVHCLTSNGTTPTICNQQPTAGPSGGAQFAGDLLAPGAVFELQVPVVFSTASDGAAVVVRTVSTWGTIDASVGVTVPFQPAVPQNTRGVDLALIGSSLADAGTLPIAFTNDNGTFTVTDYPVGDFATWARAPGVQRISGDFNHDGLTDYALVGGPGWNTIPVALSQGNGRFTITNSSVGNFDAWASTAHVTVLAGDFNRDGYTDIALVGGAGWTAIPVAFSTGNGNFAVTGVAAPDFAGWAAQAGVKPLVGDFNKDGMTDIALVGGAGWTTLPVAFSYGNGAFQITNAYVGGLAGPPPMIPWNFAAAAREPGVQIVVGDFNKDGYSDIAIVGGKWESFKIAMSLSGGQFASYERSFEQEQFASWANMPGVKVLTGDFNGDGATDIALVGGAGWASIPIAFSAGSSNPAFVVTNMSIPQFGGWASTPNVRPVVGDFNGDGYDDIALTGGVGWSSIPVALNLGHGNFTPINSTVPGFPGWSTDSTATVFAGRVNN
jgi:hypothetical protein